jgi:hypothetical protein
MYILVIVLVLLVFFFRKEEFTLYFKGLSPGEGAYLGGSTQGGFALANDLSHVSPGSLSFLTGSTGSGGSGGSTGSTGPGGGDRPLIGTGLMGPLGHHVSV